MIHVYRLLSRKYKGPTALALIETMTEAAITVCEGQQRDMDFEQLSLVSEGEYLDMISAKTAVLIGAAMKMGAITGGADAEAAERLYRFGKDAGLAFQIRDDLLDAFGDPQLTGKQEGGDIIRNKKTLLYIHAGHFASPAVRAELLRLYETEYADPAAKIARVRSIFEESGARRYCEQMISDLYSGARAQLEGVQVDSLAFRQLMAVSDQLIERRH